MKAIEKGRKLPWGETRFVHLAKFAAAAACMSAALDANAARQYWRGTTENPVWDLTTANWAADTTTSTLRTYQNGTASSVPEATFSSTGVENVTIDDGGVEAYVVNITGGNHIWRGGPVTATVFDPLGGNLTIYNTVNLCTNTASIYYGFRPRSGGSTITIGDGGTLSAYMVPFSDSTLATKLVVLTNGTLKARFSADQIKNNKFTLYFNGGTFIPLINEDRQFVNSQFLLGSGGVHLQERTAASDCWSHLPGPIGTDENLPTDGGVWIDQHEGYMLLPNFTCTYRGGVHLNSSRGKLGVRAERNLGAVPESPTNNIFFLKSGAAFISHGGNSNIRLHPNRNLYLADGVVARLQTWSGSDQSLTVQGTIGCENVSNGVVEVYSYSGISDNGVVAFCPTDDRTNHLGRLLVHAPTVIGSGTTLLENNEALSVGTGANDERWSVNDGCPLNISGSGHLMVTGGLLKVTGSRPVCTSAKLTISDGGVVDLEGEGNGGRETRHAYSGAATTTIRNGGKLIVARMRMAGDEAIATDATKSVVNVETGGTLRVTYALYVTGDGKKGTLNFNGGMLEWGNPTTGMYLDSFRENGLDYPAFTRNGLSINVLEGGMNVTNYNAFYIAERISSGAETDGGVTKWGAGTFALMGTCTFNGPLTVMQGDFRLGANNVLNSNIAMRVAAGANFIMNTYSQTFARIEGSGSIWGTGTETAILTVTSAIAPGMGADSLGTLRVVDHALNIADDVALEIDVDTEGNSDCLLYGVNYSEQIDLSKMTLQVNDTTKLNGEKKYTIAKRNGGIKDAALFKSTNLPGNWVVRYYSASHELKLVYEKGTKIIFR